MILGTPFESSFMLLHVYLYMYTYAQTRHVFKLKNMVSGFASLWTQVETLEPAETESQTSGNSSVGKRVCRH